MAAFGGRRIFIAGDGSHGQGDEEGIGGGSHHFRHLGFHQQVQTHRQIPDDGLAVFVGQRHGSTTGADHVGFQGILYGGSIGGERVGHCLVQSVRGVIVVAVAQLVGVVGVFIASGTVRQTDCFQQVSGLDFVEAVEHLGQIVVGMLVIGGLGEGHNISHPQIAEFHALDGIAVGVLAVAQRVVGLAVGIALADRFAQDFFHIGFPPAGGDKGILIPHAVLHGVGEVKFPNSERAEGIFVDGSIRNFGGKGGRSAAQAQHECQTQGNEFSEVFHRDISSLLF